MYPHLVSVVFVELVLWGERQVMLVVAFLDVDHFHGVLLENGLKDVGLRMGGKRVWKLHSADYNQLI